MQHSSDIFSTASAGTPKNNRTQTVAAPLSQIQMPDNQRRRHFINQYGKLATVIPVTLYALMSPGRAAHGQVSSDEASSPSRSTTRQRN